MSESEPPEDPANPLQATHEALIVPYQRLSAGEELANAITHGSGCIAAIVATTWVVATHPMPPAVMIGFLVYAVSLAFVFLMSTLSHVVTDPQRLHLLRAWDQGAIYLLIAGTYTPGVVAFAGPSVRPWLLLAIWLLAGFGFLSKVVGKHQVHAIDTWTYIALGWFPAMILAPGVTLDYFLWMLAGGLAYSLGVCFLLNDSKVRYFHAIWHLLVIAAAAIHYYAIYSLAL
ncbi:hemolysin-III related [Rosistilla carotiformis]|uniref:Hemolysin-III related n=1 Tax=Rosistilla carotiformis TaxID=2528017 RepID=A0A518JSF4_9BACT|nr:hemolysin III family protein [Rosistilla carotiformis]QDV68481.1 hemolysin-III related [Rosistilla carotiformis]